MPRQVRPLHAIILNFTGLAYMNNSGIGLLVTLLIGANRLQQVLTYGLNEHYRHTFALARIRDVIKTCDTEAEALAAAARR